MATSHLKDPISTTTNLDEACSLDTSCDLLHLLDSPSLSSELQDNSSVDSIEIEFLPESEGQLDHTTLSPTDVFSEHHDYELFLLQKEFDAPNANPNHYDIHTCEIQDDILIHATNLSNTFALPQIMAQHNWGRNVKLNYTSGGLNISEVDWGDHDPSTNNMNKILLSEVDWGAHHDSSFFLFLVNIDYDAKPNDSFTQELWGGLTERTTSSTLRSLNHVEGKWVHHLELQKGPSRLEHQLDLQRDPTSSPCPQHESSYNLLNQWDPGQKPLLPQLFRTTISAKIIYFLWIQSEYNLS